MDYLTNHYKNLCEQLQEKLNILEAQISEAMSEQEALGMPVPMLRTGKRGNYEQWRAANDARNAALRDARMGGGREKIIGKLVRAEDLDKKPGKADTKFPSDFFKPGYVLPGREPRPGDEGMIRPDSKPTPKDPSKPLPYINPEREPRPGDRGPIPFNPDRKPLFPGMEPNPYIKPGLKPVNPSKIPSDMFRPGKRPKGEPNSFGIPTDTDRDDLFPGGRRPIPGRNPQSDNYFPTPGTKPESIIPQSGYKPKIDYLNQDPSDRFRVGKRPRGGLLPAPGTEPETKSASDRFIDYYLHKDPSDRFRIGKSPKTDHKRPMDYLGQESLIKNTGSLPKLGDSNLIGKIPTEQEAYGGKLMSTMQQSQVDLEGNPTGLVKNIPIKPKIRK